MAEECAPDLKRDSTMEVTAQEGAEFLKRSGAEDLVAKTIAEADEEKPPVERDTTIQATVKAAEAYLEGGKIEGSTRAETEAIAEAAKESEPPKVTKDNTMVVTAKEGAEIVGDEPIAESRAQTKALKEAAEEEQAEEKKDGEEAAAEEEDEAAKSLKRTHTMAETLQEGEEFLKKQKTSNGDAAEAQEETVAVDGDDE